MNKTASFISSCFLFRGLEDAITEIDLPRPVKYVKGQLIYGETDFRRALGILVSGKAKAMPSSGSNAVLNVFLPGAVFGAAAVFSGDEVYVSRISAVTDCKVLFLSRTDALLCPCKNVCPEHLTFLKNMITSLAERNKFLMRRLGQVTQHTLREKIASYLSEERTRQKSNSLVIPHNRRELAEYLAVDRSALSAELSKMQKEGLITYEKNRFTLLNAKAFPDEE